MLIVRKRTGLHMLKFGLGLMVGWLVFSGHTTANYTSKRLVQIKPESKSPVDTVADALVTIHNLRYMQIPRY